MKCSVFVASSQTISALSLAMRTEAPRDITGAQARASGKAKPDPNRPRTRETVNSFRIGTSRVEGWAARGRRGTGILAMRQEAPALNEVRGFSRAGGNTPVAVASRTAAV